MNQEQGTLRSYSIGFFFSLLLTFAAYACVILHTFSTNVANLLIGLFALLQAWAQFILFFHLGKESKPRWNFIVFLFMVMVTIILVGGSLWIMEHLNYNLMPGM